MTPSEKPSNQCDIAFLLPSLASGGVTQMAVNLSQAFVEQGLCVDLVLVKAYGDLMAEVAPGVNIVDLKSPASIVAIPRLVRYWRQRRPRAMFSGITSINLASIIGHRLSRVDARVVISERVSLSDNVKTHFLKHLFPPLIRLFYPYAHAVVAVSQGLADDLARVGKYPRKQIHILYNPIVTPDLHKRAAQEIDHPWFQQDDIPVILGIGRLVEQKDFSTLVQGFARIRQQRPAKLMVLGDGEERAHLESLITELGIQDDVALPGYAQNPFPYLKKANVFVLSSAYEGFGNVLVEALACGCAVVSTDCNYGPSEILANGQFGKLTQVGDPNALAEGILEVLDNPPDPLILQQRAADFSVEVISVQYRKLLLPDD